MTDQGPAIEVEVGGEFTIRIDAVGTAGYRWSEEHDPACVDLVDAAMHAGAATGGGGEQEFRFRALVPGETDVRLRYGRPWEADAHETKTYRVRAS